MYLKACGGEEINIQVFSFLPSFHAAAREREKKGYELVRQQGVGTPRRCEAAAPPHCSRELHAPHRAKMNYFINLCCIPDV